MQNVFRTGRPPVDGDRSFATIEPQKVGREATACLIPGSREVPTVKTFDLDDLGSEVAEDALAQWGSDGLFEADDTHPVQRSLESSRLVHLDPNCTRNRREHIIDL